MVCEEGQQGRSTLIITLRLRRFHDFIGCLFGCHKVQELESTSSISGASIVECFRRRPC